MGPGFFFVNTISPKTAQPPIRSIDEWGAYSLIGLSNGQYLVLSWFTVRVPELKGSGNSGVPPIHKTFGTRRRLL